MAHLGTYFYRNISQQFKFTIDTVTAAVMHKFTTYYVLRI